MVTMADHIHKKLAIMGELRRRAPIMIWTDDSLVKAAQMIIDREKEAKLVHDVITHPSGMHIELFGILYVRPCDDGGQTVYEVGFEPDQLHDDFRPYEHKTFTNPMDAAIEFVNIRIAQELGIDIEWNLNEYATPELPSAK